MNLDFIDKLAALVERSGLLELEYREGDRSIRIVAGGASRPAVSQAIRTAAAPSTPLQAAPDARHIIAAGLVGVFYRSPAPGTPPFVAVGDRIAEGQTLAIVEAMKLFNPIEADRAGVIADILVADGTAVAVGTPLFAIMLDTGEI